MEADKAIEAVLFYKAAPIKKEALAKMLEVDSLTLEEGFKVLSTRLQRGATALLVSDDEVELVVSSEFDSLIEGLRKDELKRDIGKAGAETLAVVMYRSPVTRSEIDRVRGVNSSYILRALETRGLVERRVVGQRSEFRPTTELLRHLGITEKTQLLDYATVMNALENFEKQQELENE